MMSAHPTPTEAADVVSESLLYPGRSGLKIAAFWDHRREGFEGCPFVVMAPKYGETKKNNLQLAYLLAANGMNVVRFDHTSHVGESAGVKTMFTLTSGVDDIQGTLDYIEQRFGATSAALLASSLSARTAIRAAALDRRVSLLVSLVGVVNVSSTLRAVYREDVVAEFQRGRRWGLTDSFFGHDADWDHFVAEACAADMHDITGTERDLASIEVPALFFCGEDDAWVSVEEVRTVVAKAPRGRVVLISGAKHEVRENQAAAEQAFRDVVSAIVQESWGLAHPPAELRRADQRVMLAQNRLERERLRHAQPPARAESDFWSGYLKKYVLLEHVDDYCEYLDLVGELLGPIIPGEVVLDAGSGNGLYGAWLLRRLKSMPPETLPALYVALDLTNDGLADAVHRHVELAAARLFAAAKENSMPMQTAYARADFDALGGEGKHPHAMPHFADGMFDAVCCSLVLSYLVNPAQLLAELRRVLRRDGRIVVSSMKPHCDISVIYRDFVEERTSDFELQSARNLLSGVGEIKLKEEQGYYTFFSGEELCELVRAAGFRDPQVFTSFGNQAIVVRGVA